MEGRRQHCASENAQNLTTSQLVFEGSERKRHRAQTMPLRSPCFRAHQVPICEEGSSSAFAAEEIAVALDDRDPGPPLLEAQPRGHGDMASPVEQERLWDVMGVQTMLN